MRTRPLIRRLLLVAASTLTGFGLAEVGARLLAPSAGEELLFQAPDAAPKGLYRFSPTLLTEPTPNFRGEVASLGYRVPLRIDSHGLRGPEPRGGRTWLALGDSFTIAVQVSEEKTFAARIGAALGVQVLNAGVDGYSTWQATLRYRDLDPAVQVDTVLLTFFLGNDLEDNERVPIQLRAPLPPGKGGHAPPELSTDPITRLLFRHSVLHAYVRVAWKRAAMTGADDFDARRFREELLPFTRGGAERLAVLVRTSERPLMELRDLVASRGDRLIVAVAPPAFAMDPVRAEETLSAFGLSEPDVAAPRTAILDLLGRLHIRACDLSPGLEAAAAAGEDPYFRFDGHWTDAGHATVANAVVACAREP